MSTAKNLTPLILGITSAPGAADPGLARLLADAPAPVHEVRVDPGANVVVLALAPGAVLAADLATDLADDLAAGLPGTAAGELPWPRVPALTATVAGHGDVTVATYAAAGIAWAVSFCWPTGGGPEPALDRRTGALTLAGRVLTPRTDRFTADALRIAGLPAVWHRGGADWATLRLRVDQPDGTRWRAGLAFDGTRLKRVRLSYGWPDDPADWSSVDEERERERLRYHDAWLAAQPPGRRRLPAGWGTVSSSYDARDIDSSISLDYA